MNRLFYKLGVGIVSVVLFGSVAVGPAMAADSASASQNQALEQQFESEVNQGQVSQAQKDLQTLEQNAGYTQPTPLNAISDLLNGLLQSFKNANWSVADTLNNEIQTLSQQYESTVNQNQLSHAQQDQMSLLQNSLSSAQRDLKTLEQNAGYTTPSTSDLQTALTQAVNNGDWTVANALFNEIMTLENGTNTSGSGTTPTSTQTASPPSSETVRPAK